MMLPSRAVATAAALFYGLGLLAGCDRPRATAPATAPAASADSAAPRYADVLAALDAEIARLRGEAQKYPRSWGEREQLAGVYLQRAQLSGDYNDFAAAQALPGEAQALAGNAAAVCLTRAKLEFAVHRLAAAETAAKSCDQRLGLPAGAYGELRGLTAEIALYRGRYAEALAQMRAALAEEETITGLARLSRYHAKTGNTVEALALLDRAERSYFGDSAQLRAWLALQRAIVYLESGRWDDALAYLLAAQRALDGWWLIDEHIAEVHALRGETEAARALYRSIVERTGIPEYLSAWASLERGAGNQALAQDLSGRAEALFRQRLARWPEAAAGHALDHFLEPGGDPAEAVALAEANLRNRPYGDAQIQLARAYLKAGRVRDARAAIAPALNSVWSTAELHIVAAQIYAAAGNAAAAQAQRARALPLNPRAERQYGPVS